MKFGSRPKAYKKCPRCLNKCLRQQETCEECGLIFARLQYASNKAAKKKIRHFDKDFVIYTNQYPSDVSWWKLLLLVFLTGLVGGHYYYVGKYFKGALMTTGFVYLVFCTIFNPQMVEALTTYYAYLPIGILGIAWLASLIYVACKKFKVPVIVEVPQQEVLDKREKFFADVEKTVENADQKQDVKNENEIVPDKPTAAKPKSKKKQQKENVDSSKDENQKPSKGVKE